MLTKEQEKRIRDHFYHIYPDGKLVLHTRPERIFDDATIHALIESDDPQTEFYGKICDAVYEARMTGKDGVRAAVKSFYKKHEKEFENLGVLMDYVRSILTVDTMPLVDKCSGMLVPMCVFVDAAYQTKHLHADPREGHLVFFQPMFLRSVVDILQGQKTKQKMLLYIPEETACGLYSHHTHQMRRGFEEDTKIPAWHIKLWLQSDYLKGKLPENIRNRAGHGKRGGHHHE